MRVLLVDDQPLFLEGLQNLLAARGIEVVGQAGDGLEALEKARALHPNVILMDIQMPRCDGLEGTRLIKAEMPDIKILMLTVSAADEDLFEAVKSGASGYLLKNMDAGEFFEVITALLKGEAPLSRGLAARILEEFALKGKREETTEADEGENDELAASQIAVLNLVAQGLTYKEVGEALSLSERLVKCHIGQILERLHLRSRVQAVGYAKRTGFISAKNRV